MRILLFGATGMIGQGVLRECLQASDVSLVQTIGRTATGKAHAKLHEIIVPDLFETAAYASKLSNFDACFYCLGVSSAGMTEDAYTRLTFDLTYTIAEALTRLNPAMTFVYVSGAGTDSSEHGRTMWARVKGRLENALLRMPFRAAYMFRPGLIVPLHGIVSKTRAYRIMYGIMKPFLPLMRQAFPSLVVTTEEMGQAMLAVARHGAAKSILETQDLRALLNKSNG